MDLSGIAALCALAGIPVTLVVARWQKRAALEQMEANHRTALAVAEATHQSALDLAEVRLRHELIMARAERYRQLEEARRSDLAETYRLFRKALDKISALVASGVDAEAEFHSAFGEVHDLDHAIGVLRVDGEVRRLVHLIRVRCEDLAFRGMTAAERDEVWRAEVRPLRYELNREVRNHLDPSRREPRPPRP
ncbi:hypothetical protein [Streptomyces sp. NPDC002855]|uniref:hypothetical protein n=1 Tax=Streptomyces sp. NPDC002855 TaxID=3154437 RepID=UPI003318CC80